VLCLLLCVGLCPVPVQSYGIDVPKETLDQMAATAKYDTVEEIADLSTTFGADAEFEEWKKGLPKTMQDTVTPYEKNKKDPKTSLDTQEDLSTSVPKYLRCEACNVVAYQMHQTFNHTTLHKKASESRIIEMLDNTCTRPRFAVYSLQHREYRYDTNIAGPGGRYSVRPMDSLWPGLVAVWLKNYCVELVGEIGEEEIYEEYLVKKHVHHTERLTYFQDFVCMDICVKGQKDLKEKYPEYYDPDWSATSTLGEGGKREL